MTLFDKNKFNLMKNIIPTFPRACYNNMKTQKKEILKEKKNKIGIYKLTNTITNESYVGSSINLTSRIRKYYSFKYIKNKALNSGSRISKAIFNYKINNFKFEILEYCNKESLIEKEQYYIDKLSPKYNVLKFAGSSLGFKHSIETKLKLKARNSNKGYNITVFDQINNTIKKYNSIRVTAKTLEVSHTTVLNYLNKNKLLKKIENLRIAGTASALGESR